jgi:4-amino-4-deoxy-L-arabinose transferase-like glycosyltransferase
MLLIAWCGFLFLYGLDAGPLYRTESLRAIIGRECLHGHWLFPVLYGEPFLTKPPGHYAAIAVCSLLPGDVSAATARLPSVIAATAAVLLMYGLFRCVLGTTAGLLIGLILPTSVLWLDKVPSAEIDMTLVGWVTAAMVFFHRSIRSPARVSASCLTLSLLCVAGGTLTKWTAPAFFYLTVVPLLAWRGELRILFGWRHGLALATAAATCSLWVMAVTHEIGWAMLIETVHREAAYRFAPRASSGGYPWSGAAGYPLLVLAAHLPLSLLALRTLRPGFAAQWDERGKLLLQLLHCWTWPNLLFWSLVPNHNVRYLLPMSPGLMGLGVMGLLGLLPRVTRFGPVLSLQGRSKQAMVAFLVFWICAKIAFVELVVPRRTASHDPVPIAARLRELVPADHTLSLCRVKDEGVMFYYARPVIRLKSPLEVPAGGYAILMQEEWAGCPEGAGFEVAATLRDQQGAPLILVMRISRENRAIDFSPGPGP